MRRRRFARHLQTHRPASHEPRPHPPSAAAMPLSLVSPGETVELVEIAAGQTLKKRLADLGLNTGAAVRVMQNSIPGPLILAVKDDTRLAIGRGMAQKIRVAVPDRHQGQDE